MSYPFWDAGVPYGPLMAVIAVVHVFVSHFAIGGGLYLVVSEHAARRSGDTARLDFLRRLSRFFVLVTVVFGALTGVAIWFVIGLLSPAGTEALIHNFVWGWATEWTFFIVEILAALLYYYGWQRLPARTHLTLGWIYFGAAWLSLFVINGIITFMLTPGAWLATGGFWDGFFNPTFWPSLVFRTGICVLLAGLFAQVVAARLEDAALRTRLARQHALWGLAGLLLVVPAWLWYRGAIPAEFLTRATTQLTIPAASLDLLQVLALALAAALVVLGLLLPRAWRTPAAVGMLALGLACFGAFEWFRESARKPYVIAGYMYGNGLPVAALPALEQDGVLAHVPYRGRSDGETLFRATCATCHTIDGYNPLRRAYDGTDEAFVAESLKGLHVMRSQMPPFPGTAEERQTLARYIHERVDRRPFEQVHPLEGVALGRRVYEVRCGRCHVRGGWKDKTRSLEGLEPADYEELLTETEFDPAMPRWTGSRVELDALVRYLATWGKEGDRP
jgi:mono/diheme cytochrome c family protein